MSVNGLFPTFINADWKPDAVEPW